MNWEDSLNDTLDHFTIGLVSSDQHLLTEGDLEVATVNAVKEGLRDQSTKTTVNTQSPWHDETTGRRLFFIDVTVFESDALEVMHRATDPRKGYRYHGKSAAIELKFIRHKSDMQGVQEDISKMRLLAERPNNRCFVIAVGRTDDLTQQIIEDVKSNFTEDGGGSITVIVQSLETEAFRIIARA